jgi:hypothetical protein
MAGQVGRRSCWLYYPAFRGAGYVDPWFPRVTTVVGTCLILVVLAVQSIRTHPPVRTDRWRVPCQWLAWTVFAGFAAWGCYRRGLWETMIVNLPAWRSATGLRADG